MTVIIFCRCCCCCCCYTAFCDRRSDVCESGNVSIGPIRGRIRNGPYRFGFSVKPKLGIKWARHIPLHIHTDVVMVTILLVFQRHALLPLLPAPSSPSSNRKELRAMIRANGYFFFFTNLRSNRYSQKSNQKRSHCCLTIIINIFLSVPIFLKIFNQFYNQRK